MKTLTISNFGTFCTNEELTMLYVLTTLVMKIDSDLFIDHCGIGQELLDQVNQSGQVEYNGYTIKLS